VKCFEADLAGGRRTLFLTLTSFHKTLSAVLLPWWMDGKELMNGFAFSLPHSPPKPNKLYITVYQQPENFFVGFFCFCQHYCTIQFYGWELIYNEEGYDTM
jgi:hypothetical protein